MGRLQAVLQAFAVTTDGPAEVVRRLDAVTSAMGRGMVATVGYGEFDPASRLFRYACAGHLPPLLVDGTARYLPGRSIGTARRPAARPPAGSGRRPPGLHLQDDVALICACLDADRPGRSRDGAG